MKVEAFKLRTFNGGVGPLVVRRAGGQVHWLANRSFAVDVVATGAAEFDELYEPVALSEKRLRSILDGLRLAALSKGMTVRAADVLPKLVALSKKEVEMSTEDGSAAEGRILDDAAKEHQKDGAPSGKAPRKLAGAALKAAEAKKAREAAAKEEAKADAKPAKAPKPKKASPKSEKASKAEKLAAEVTADIQQEEGNQVKRNSPKPTDLTMGKTSTAKIGKPRAGAKELASPKKGKTEGFDPASLKKDGQWRSASAMLKGLIYEGKIKDDAKIFAAVQKQFPDLTDDKSGYVAWNRGWFKRNGIQLPA